MDRFSTLGDPLADDDEDLATGKGLADIVLVAVFFLLTDGFLFFEKKRLNFGVFCGADFSVGTATTTSSSGSEQEAPFPGNRC